MSQYILIDSNDELRSQFSDYHCIGTFNKSIEAIAQEAHEHLGIDSTVLIHAETEIQGKLLQEFKAIELVYLLRCKYHCKNPIVVYSSFSLSYLLRKNPEHFILASPSCYYYPVLPPLPDSGAKFTPLQQLEDIRPFLKPRVDEILKNFRHRYANYSGMALTLEAAGIDSNTFEPLRPNTDFKSFTDSLDFAILIKYFGFSAASASASITNKVRKKKILLVDDLAQDGWLPILRQVIYNDPNAEQLDFAEVALDDKRDCDEAQTFENTKEKILLHKPHLILLDLRLGDETGPKEVDELGGYHLLTQLKTNDTFKGVPIIMFTASANAETVKTLMRAGATAVWTKLGIDESLTKERVAERYIQLLGAIDGVFGEFGKIIQGLNEGSSTNISFEEERTNLLKKLDWLNYRIKLSQGAITTDFDDYTDIIIDTNFFISGDEKQTHLDFEKTFVNVFCLINLLKDKKTEHSFDVNGIIIKKEFPKVILLNSIIDEILNFAKTFHGSQPQKWKRSLLSFDILRTLFDKEMVRTELVYLKNKKPVQGLQFLNTNETKSLTLRVMSNLTKVTGAEEVEFELRNSAKLRSTTPTGVSIATNTNGVLTEIKIETPKIDPDDLIVAEVRYIVDSVEFEIKSNVKIKFITSNSKVLVLTNENARDSDRIPMKIKSAIKAPDKCKTFNIKIFNHLMDSIVSKL